MSWFQFLILWVALVACGTYLYAKQRQRLRHWTPGEDPKKWTGHSIDASKLKPRLERVRQNYLAAWQSATGYRFHSNLLAFTRRTILRLGYFRHRGHEDQAHVKSL